MKYLLEQLNKVPTIKVNDLDEDSMCSMVFRTTYMLQNFVYWESIILSKNKTPEVIKKMLLNDISEEVSNLKIGTHATLASDFRNKIKSKTNKRVSTELLKEIGIMSDFIVKEISENGFLFGLAFLTTIENYNSMDLLEEIASKLGIGKILYVSIHQIEDHSEGGHADIFGENLKKYISENEELYKKGIDLAIKMIKFRLGIK